MTSTKQEMWHTHLTIDTTEYTSHVHQIHTYKCVDFWYRTHHHEVNTENHTGTLGFFLMIQNRILCRHLFSWNLKKGTLKTTSRYNLTHEILHYLSQVPTYQSTRHHILKDWNLPKTSIFKKFILCHHNPIHSLTHTHTHY